LTESERPKTLTNAITEITDMADFTKDQRRRIEEICCDMLATGFMAATRATEDDVAVLELDWKYTTPMVAGFRRGALSPGIAGFTPGCESGGITDRGQWSCKCGVVLEDGPAWIAHARPVKA
jgi:hypothetical protein